jgi:hypothetical protein
VSLVSRVSAQDITAIGEERVAVVGFGHDDGSFVLEYFAYLSHFFLQLLLFFGDGVEYDFLVGGVVDAGEVFFVLAQILYASD